MDRTASAMHARFEDRLSCEDFPGPKVPPKDDASPLLDRVKKALAYCRKCTRLSRSRSTTAKHDDIGLKSMSSARSTPSRRPAYNRRSAHNRCPTLHEFGQGESSMTQKDGSESSHYSDDCDPFITSPSWFREEYFDEDAARV